MNDIPSAVTTLEREKLRHLARGKRVLEIGALLGHSTVALAKVAEHVVSVDPHRGYPQGNPRGTLYAFTANLWRAGVLDKVTVIVDTHDRALPLLAGGQFDGVFIDCTGEYDLTVDVMAMSCRLLRHHGWMAVHDCGHPDWPGALKAVEDFGRPFTLVDRLAVIEGTWS